MATIAELFGQSSSVFRDPSLALDAVRRCPITGGACDVTNNRHHTAWLDLNHPSVTDVDRHALIQMYGAKAFPFGVCSISTRRQNERETSPWILCPKRLLVLEPPRPFVPPEVADLIPLPPGTRVRVLPELKIRLNDLGDEDGGFFEYTFDYLIHAIDNDGNVVGPPYIIEVMTSSTRGGGLTEHMVDVLLGRDQRRLRNVVKSPYTPNYRQVFARMLSQFVAKSEVAESWGGRAIWVVQDVLLKYIEQTTAFSRTRFQNGEKGNVFVEVYGLSQPGLEGVQPGLSTDDESSGRRLADAHLVHVASLRGPARWASATIDPEAYDFTSMLGLGHAPTLTELHALLNRAARKKVSNWFEFDWPPR